MEVYEQIGPYESAVQITQRRPIHIPQPFSDCSSLLRSQGETGRGRTDSKVHSSLGNDPTLSQSDLSLAINSLIKVVTWSGVCVHVGGA